MKKLIAQFDIRQSNSMNEAANKRIKFDYLFTKELLDFHAPKTYLSSTIESFHNKPLDVAICMHTSGSIAWNCPG